MSMNINDLKGLLAPVTVPAFMAESNRQKPLYIPGTPEKLTALMGWDRLSALLSQTGIWTQRTLELTHQLKKIPPQDYCQRGLDRDMRDNWLADIDRVRAWLKQGASLVLNDIASLTPELQAVANCLESEIGGKAQANLYCSWRAHPGFGTHYDTHDVFALHVAGTKLWKIYECPTPDPVTHPYFKSQTPEFHLKNRGAVTLEVTLKPGDVLYIPRGWYHDALATSDATIHVTFSVTPLIGLDVISQLFERAVQEPSFRAALPRAHEREKLAACLASLGDRLANLAREPALLDHMAKLAENYRYHRRVIQLPDEVLAEKAPNKKRA